MDPIPRPGPPSDFRTVHQIPGLSAAEQRALRKCVDAASKTHLTPRRLWRDQDARAKAALKREAMRKCAFLARYADQWPVETLAAQILRTARSQINRRKAAAGARNGDGEYGAARRRPATRRDAASVVNQAGHGDDMESEDETVRASSEETPAGGSGELALPEGDRSGVGAGAPAASASAQPVPSAARRDASAAARSPAPLGIGSADSLYVVAPQHALSSARLAGPAPAGAPASSRASAASASSERRDGETASGLSTGRRDTRNETSSSMPSAAPSVVGGARSPGPDGPKDGLGLPSSVEAAPSARGTSSSIPGRTIISLPEDPDPGPPFVHTFLHGISPVLASGDVVARFAAAGVVTRVDLYLLALLSREGQGEVLREDVGLSVVQARVVCESLGRV